MTFYRLEEMFPTEIARRLNEKPILLLPFGTIEWHSHHLPIGLDGIVAQGICEQIADRLGAVLAPTSYSAVGGVPYPYTLDHAINVIEPLYVSMFEQYGAMGFKVIVAFTGHFGLAQTLTIKRAALRVMRRSPLTILPATEYDMTTDAGYKGDHAAVGETSLLWHLRNDLVRLDAVESHQPLDGVLGKDPRGEASEELGKRFLDLISERVAEVAARLLTETNAVARRDYIAALNAGVRVLTKTQAERDAKPKAIVPSIGSHAWLEYCQAMYRGDYREAKIVVERKLADLSQ